MMSKVLIALCVSMLVIVSAESSVLNTSVIPRKQASNCVVCKEVISVVMPYAYAFLPYLEDLVAYIEQICPTSLPKAICDTLADFMNVILDDIKNHVNSEKFCKDMFFC